jgi:hypothetical protein
VPYVASALPHAHVLPEDAIEVHSVTRLVRLGSNDSRPMIVVQHVISVLHALAPASQSTMTVASPT